MELFLQTLLKLSLLGSILALALAALRPLLRGRVSRRAAYYLWLLVLLRLCMPVGINLPVPVASEEPVPVPPAAVQTVPVLPEAGPVIEPEMSEPIEAPEPTPQPDAIASDPPQEPLSPAQAALASSARSPMEVLKSPYLWGALWWFGTLASVWWFMLGYLRASDRVLQSAGAAAPEAYRALAELDPTGKVQLAESPMASTPLLLGVLRPVIVLPCGVRDPARLRDILIHELTHVRRHDLLFKWFAAVVTSLHWFNPAMLLVRREIGRTCELSCDEAVMRGMDERGRRHYGETLLALAAHAPRGLGPLAVTLCEEKKQLKERLTYIVKYKKSGPMVLFLSLVLAAVVGACAMVTGVTPMTPDAPEPPKEDDQTLPEQPEDVTVYELDGGLTIAFPNDVVDQLLVFTDHENWQGTGGYLVSVYEKRSYEESNADWSGTNAGYLFGITRYTQDEYEEYLAADGSGVSPIATDGTFYYMYTFATDVQFYRSDVEEYNDAVIEPWYELEAQMGGVINNFITRNGLQKPLSAFANELYQRITDPQGDGQYDFTARVKHSNQTDEIHVTPENGYNVAFVGNYLTTSYIWEEADVGNWVARDYLGTVLTLVSADGKSSICCRSADGIVELVQDGETRYARVWDPETPEDPDPNLRYSLYSFLMNIPEDAYSSSAWDGTADGTLSPAEAAKVLAESVAENYRKMPKWLDWVPQDFQVESAEVFDIYNGEDAPQFCFGAGFLLLLGDANDFHWQVGSGLGESLADGPFAGYYKWGREVGVAKNSDGNWYMADMGTGGYSVDLPGWSFSYGTENYVGNASLEELADLFFLTEGWTHDYILANYICERSAESLAGLNDLLDRHTRTEAQELCRALAAYLNAGFGTSNGNTLKSVEDLNALLAPAYQAYTADVPAWEG